MQKIIFHSAEDIEDPILRIQTEAGIISLKEAENIANQRAISSAVGLDME
jgi:hypothetical protein